MSDADKAEGWNACLEMVAKHVNPYIQKQFEKNPYENEEDQT